MCIIIPSLVPLLGKSPQEVTQIHHMYTAYKIQTRMKYAEYTQPTHVCVCASKEGKIIGEG